MLAKTSILITGAAGNLGAKLRRHLEGRYELRLIDREPRGDAAIVAADLATWDAGWTAMFRGVDCVIHLAADPVAYRSWDELVSSNIDATVNVFLAAVNGGVRRVVFASSNHVMGGYQEIPDGGTITADLPPLPGTRYFADGAVRDSTPYAAAKLFGERLGKMIADAHGLSVIAVRLGWVWRGDNRPEDLPSERGAWFRNMWLSNRDFCQLMECCMTVDPGLRFAIVNGMSNNAGMRWDLEATRRLVGYEARDGVGRVKSEESRLLSTEY